ncbi:hypothetical protein FBR02_08910 [Anaerolineae bacterium CFX9]|jgi:hypothetical protein|nr:hypothetical protein [Anaerolineae bacterium CFX9]
MPGLYDHLSGKVGDDEPAGITPLDITDLPADQKQVMLSLLRDQAGMTDGVTSDMLRSKLSSRIDDLEKTVNDLSRLGWLIISGEAPNLRYRVNLRAKRASNSVFGLWSILSDRVSQPKKRDS